MVGRPSKLTPEIQAEIVKRVAVGSYADVAAVAAGIRRSTFLAWLRRGRKQKQGRYRDFLVAIARAEAEGEVQALALIRQAMQGGQVLQRVTRRKRDGAEEVMEKLARANWAAARWFAERRHPVRWGRKETEVLAKLIREVTQLRRLIPNQARVQEPGGNKCSQSE